MPFGVESDGGLRSPDEYYLSKYMARQVRSISKLIAFGKNTAGKFGRRLVGSTGRILHRAPAADTEQLANVLRTRIVGLRTVS